MDRERRGCASRGWRDLGGPHSTGASALAELGHNHPGETVGVVTHSGVIRAVRLSVLGLPFKRLREVPVPANTGFVTLETIDDGSHWAFHPGEGGLAPGGSARCPF